MSDLFGIDGAHVLVTGGSSGLGRFFASFLAGRGARVTVAARRAEALAKIGRRHHLLPEGRPKAW